MRKRRRRGGETRCAVFSKRGPNNTGWQGTNKWGRPREPQHGPREAPEGPKRFPREPQEGHR
eukprot:8004363-Pyramimonas_sp.AAC.1